MNRPVLFCYDGSEGSMAALSVAVELIMRPADAVVLVVWTPIAVQLARGGSLLAAVPNEGEMDEEEIEYVLHCFGEAARRAMSAGLDGVELHLGHGYMPWQFLSPLYNLRKDRWGGSYENRLRFPLECVRRIRKRIGDRKPMCNNCAISPQSCFLTALATLASPST